MSQLRLTLKKVSTQTYSEVVESLQVGAGFHGAGVELEGLGAHLPVSVEENLPLDLVGGDGRGVHDDVPEGDFAYFFDLIASEHSGQKRSKLYGKKDALGIWITFCHYEKQNHFCELKV